MSLDMYDTYYALLDAHYFVLFSSTVRRIRVGVAIRFSVWLVSGYAHVLNSLQLALTCLMLQLLNILFSSASSVALHASSVL